MSNNGSDKSGRTKLDTAIDRARGVTPTTSPPGPSSPPEMGRAEMEAMGLTIFDGGASGDIQVFDRSAFEERLRTGGHTMIERYLSLEPGQQVVAFLLGHSATLIDSIEGNGKRYMPKLHLELPKGARVSLLYAAQLASLFHLPMDGSTEVVVVRGNKVGIGDGRTMGNWGCSRRLGARPATHPAGTASAEVEARALLHAQLCAMSTEDLMRISNAPEGLLAPYIDAAKQREYEERQAAKQQEASQERRTTPPAQA